MIYSFNDMQFIQKFIEIMCKVLDVDVPEIITSDRINAKFEVKRGGHQRLVLPDVDEIRYLLFQIAHEVRHIYQYDVGFDEQYEQFVKQDNDEYMIDYIEEVKQGFFITSLFKDEDAGKQPWYNDLFIETDADAFAWIAVNVFFAEGEDNMYFPPLGNQERADKIFDLVMKLIHEEDIPNRIGTTCSKLNITKEEIASYELNSEYFE